MSIDWNSLRVWDGSQQTAFEELCCQLARYENVPEGAEFIRKGTPDAGVECYWKLRSGEEWGWQAKFFTKTPEKSQWSELDDSVKTVLNKHPHITKYIICIPLDRADPRIEKQKWFMDKWNDRVETWTEIAIAKGMKVKFEYWGTFEIFERLTRDEHKGRLQFWFNKDLYDIDWFKTRLDTTIANVGARYTPKLNVDTPICKTFESLCCSTLFIGDIEKLCGNIIKAFNKISEAKIKRVSEQKYNELSIKINQVKQLKDYIRLILDKPIDWQVVVTIMEEFAKSIDKLNHQIYLQKSQSEQQTNNYGAYDYSSETHYLQKLRKSIYEMIEYMEECSINLTNARSLLVLGDAGCGKTHLFSDIARRRNDSGYPTILLLGGYFYNQEPWSQILRLLDVKCNAEEFLSILNTIGETKKCRVLIMIDALNEGEGKWFWKNHIAGVIERVKKHKWLSIAISVRSTYETSVIPEYLDEDKLIKVTHYGFTSIEYDAANEFFDYYGIRRPSVPLLVPEFRNPLFLKLFCQSIKNNGMDIVPPGIEGLNNIFNFYIESVNKKISGEEFLNINPKLNIVKKAVFKIAEEMIAQDSYYIGMDIMTNLLEEIYRSNGYENSLYRHLISEGLISEDRRLNRNGKWEEVVRFSFERFSDFIISDFLISKWKKDKTQEIYIEELLNKYLKDSRSCRKYKGIIEAFFVQFPESIGKELFELVPECKEYDSVKDAFLNSFVWRDPKFISDATVRYINEYIMPMEDTRSQFLNNILLVSSHKDHPFNAERLHKLLTNMKLPDRDEFWSIYLHYQYGEKTSVDRIIDWALSNTDKSYITDDVIELISITLTWFLTSSNRYLRDNATKALVNILTDRVNVMISLIKRFIDVDDPYVTERLLCAVYGCVLRSKKISYNIEIVRTVYKLIFDKEGEIYPNVLLRDYARGIIEFVLTQVKIEDIDISKIRPPYKSSFNLDIPSKEQIKKLVDNKHKEYNDWSMNTLYTSIIGYGDFARYVIGTNSNCSCWSAYRMDEPEPKTSKETLNEFVLSLDKEQHILWEEYYSVREELNLSSLREFLSDKENDEEIDENLLEEQCSELENRFIESLDSDKIAIYNEYIVKYLNGQIEDRRKKFDLEFIQRWIFNRVLELGWSIERFGYFDSNMDRYTYRGREADKPERIGKKYQWIALYEILARLSDNYKYIGSWDDEIGKYEGPWQLSYMRNIDPSITIKNTHRNYEKNCWWNPVEYNNWDAFDSDKSWLKEVSDLPDVKKLIDIKHNSDKSEWLALENYCKWEEDTPVDKDRYEVPTKEVWYMVKSYIIRKRDLGIFYSWSKQQNFMGRWMPEAGELIHVFLGEFYWSPVYFDGVGGDSEWIKECDHGNMELPCEVLLPNIDYLCEKGVYDCSLDEPISITLPSKSIVDMMGLKWDGKDYKFYNKEGKLIAFDPSIDEEGPSSLLINKEEFLKFLDDNDLSIVWTLLGEKNIINSSHTNTTGWLEISGIYKIDGNNIVGHRNEEFMESRNSQLS